MSHGDHLDVHPPHGGEAHDELPTEPHSEASLESQPPKYWRSPEHREATPAELKASHLREFADSSDTLELDPVDRRSFLGLMGASLALAGTSLACSAVRKPAREILPWSKRPEDLIPGNPVFYATAMNIGAHVVGLLVESQDGRPTKVEGNPRHPMSRGGTSAWVQASVLDLYDPDRSRIPWLRGEETTWDAANAALAQLAASLKASGGAGLSILLDGTPSATRRRLLGEISLALPQAKMYRHDLGWPENGIGALASLGLPHVRLSHDLEKADVIVSVDCDFMGTDGDTVANSRGWAERRRKDHEGHELNRLYVVEPTFSITGATADHRLRLKASEARAFLSAVTAKVLASGVAVPVGAEALASSLSGSSFRDTKWVDAVAADLVAHSGKGAVLVGERHPAAVHTIAHLLNSALGNVGTTVRYLQLPGAPIPAQSLTELAAAIEAGQIETLVILGCNPAYSAPADLGFAAKLGKVKTSVHLGQSRDETGSLCTWHVPEAHWLESWGDLVSLDGTLALQQPLIAPLFGAVTQCEFLARLLGQTGDGHALTQATLPWLQGLGVPVAVAGTSAAAPASTAAVAPTAATAPIAVPTPEALALDASWRQALSDGVAGQVGSELSSPGFDWAGGGLLVGAPVPAAEGLEVNFVLGSSAHDGRFANNAWLQELPDPMTKLTWDNAACISMATAEKLGLDKGDRVTLGTPSGKLELGAWPTPGIADDVVVLALGGGRTAAGRVGNGVGWNANLLRSTTAPWFGPGTLVKASGQHDFACTQEYGTLVEPKTGKSRDDLVRVVTVAELTENPKVIEEMETIEAEHLHSLWVEPNVRTGQQWGMTIDLDSCTGCNACTMACQAENNISVVGKERVKNGREMHWIRLDRYFTGDLNDPEVVMQPLPCMQCENAPCEQVCPVAATSHSPDGLNDMAYNRCIGTRYCANNCPFKVRRFNFFNYALENDLQFQLESTEDKRPILDQVVNRGQPFTMISMQRNPDVSVRFRGVMEKCTYCVQRISQAKIAAKVGSDGHVPDGQIVTACQQACPTKAITFGDVSDASTAVSRAKSSERNYAMLAELNIKPRTSYLARLKNTNPALK